MSTRARLTALVTALLVVELAGFWKLSKWLGWTNEPWLAYTSGLALVALLLAAIVALGWEMPSAMRRRLHLAGVWIFLVQALANCLIAYQFGLTALPVEVVTRFFNVGPDVALKSMAVIQGATLSLVSIVYWGVASELLRARAAEQAERATQLRKLEELFPEADHAQ